MATEKQIEYIQDLIYNLNPEVVVDIFDDLGISDAEAPTLEELSVGMASELIDYLKDAERS